MHYSPPTQPTPGTRSTRLLASALLAACLLLAALGSPATSPPVGAAQQPTPGVGAAPPFANPPPTALDAAFAAAAARYDVPPALLRAIGWAETHWQVPVIEEHDAAGGPEVGAGRGIMALTVPPVGDSLARAAALTGLSEAQLMDDQAANIAGAAALLRAAANEQKGAPLTAGSDLAAWQPAVARYSAFPDPRVAGSYAYSVFTVLQNGVSAPAADGTTLTIAPQAALAALKLVDPLAVAPATDDYPPAVWVAAHPNNYTVGRPYPPLTYIIIHDIEGTYQSAISWFQNPNAHASTQFVMRSSDGAITQMVHNADTAWHAGNWDVNVRAIGIEHEGYQSQQGWYTEAMYNSSADLVRTMADRFGLLKDHAHIIGHYQVPNQTHTDPGQYWRWEYYLSKVRRDSAVVARVGNSSSGFSATPPQRDPAHFWWTYGGAGYNGGTALSTHTTNNPANSTNSATWQAALPQTGTYDLYAYIPWVNNGNAETTSARYTVRTAAGDVTVTMSQKALTDAGVLQGGTTQGEWAHLGRFAFGLQATVRLSDLADDSGKNLWFDALMWIPTNAAPPPIATNTPVPPATNTPTRTPTRTPTWTPTRTPTWTPTWTPTPVPPTATDTPIPTATPGPCGMSYSDLPATHWAYPYVGYLYCRGLAWGYSCGPGCEEYRPNVAGIRADLAKMIVLGMGWTIYQPATPTFRDVPFGSPYYPFIETAYTYGIISGYDCGPGCLEFRPDASVTRTQLCKMISLAKGWTFLSPPTATFADVPVGSWPFAYVETAAAHGIISGYTCGGPGEPCPDPAQPYFRPYADITRAQIAKMWTLSLQQAGPGARPRK